MSESQQTGGRAIKRPALRLIVFVLLAPLLRMVLAVYGILALLLHIALWLTWGPLGRNVLFVYSNSPIWQEYVEQNILPQLPATAVVFNWSERRNWSRLTLGYLAFRFFAGSREFNPMAVVIRPLRRARCFRFWKPFRDLKHGKPEALRKMERDFFDHLGRTRRPAI